MSTPPANVSSQKSSFGSCLIALVRLILVVILGALLGLAIYTGLLYLYQQAILPAQESAARLDLLETRQAISQQEMDNRIKQIGSRLNTLETQKSQDAESLAELQGDLASLEARLADQTAALKQLDELEKDIDNLWEIVTYNSTRVMGLWATQNAPNTTLQELSRQVQVMKAMQLLNRGRLLMLQSNWGLAEADVAEARRALVELQAEAPAYQQETIARWIQRLDLVLASLPESPVLAADDLEIAWRMLAMGLPAPGETLTPQPTPYRTGTVGAPPTPSPTAVSRTGVPATPSRTPTPFLTGAATITATPSRTP